MWLKLRKGNQTFNKAELKWLYFKCCLEHCCMIRNFLHDLKFLVSSKTHQVHLFSGIVHLGLPCPRCWLYCRPLWSWRTAGIPQQSRHCTNHHHRGLRLVTVWMWKGIHVYALYFIICQIVILPPLSRATYWNHFDGCLSVFKSHFVVVTL